MDRELAGVLDRGDELTAEFVSECERQKADSPVTERAKNLFHEVLIKLRSALDMFMYRVGERYATPAHTRRRRPFNFPICDEESNFDKRMKKMGLEELAARNSSLYEAIRRAQPFVTNRGDLRQLRDLANLGKHVCLVSQSQVAVDAMAVSGPRGTVIYTEGTQFIAKEVVGFPIDPTTQTPIGASAVRLHFIRAANVAIDSRIFCVQLCQSTRRYLASLLALIGST